MGADESVPVAQHGRIRNRYSEEITMSSTGNRGRGQPHNAQGRGQPHNTQGRGQPHNTQGRGRANFNSGSGNNSQHQEQNKNDPQMQGNYHKSSSAGQNQQNRPNRGGQQSNQDQREMHQQKDHFRSKPSLLLNPSAANQPFYDHNLGDLAGNATSHSVSFTFHTSQMNVSPSFTDKNQGGKKSKSIGSSGTNVSNIPYTGASNSSHIQIFDKNRQSSAPFHPRGSNNFQGNRAFPPHQVRPNFQNAPGFHRLNQGSNQQQNFRVSPMQNITSNQQQNFRVAPFQNNSSNQNPNQQQNFYAPPLQNNRSNQKQNFRVSPLQNSTSNQNLNQQQNFHVSPLQNSRSNQQQNFCTSPLQNSRSNQNQQDYINVSPLQNFGSNKSTNYLQNFHASAVPLMPNKQSAKFRSQPLNSPTEHLKKDFKPVYKKAENATSSNINQQSQRVKRNRKKLNKSNTTTQQKSTPDTQISRKQQQKNFFSKQKKSVGDNAPSLFSFQRVPVVVPASTDRFSDAQDSDEDCDSAIISVCSSRKSSETMSSEESSEEESEIFSELSIGSSMKSSDVISYKSQISMPDFQDSSKPETFISSFWDIENCGVPTNKSAVDFVQKIRTTFYEGRTESDFYVVCDVSNLSSSIIKELNEANATVVHTSNRDKNAADKKLQSFLNDFQFRYRNNGAVVMITGDADFSSLLYQMRYKNGICVYLICKACSATSLKKTAEKFIHYEEFIEDLPNRSEAEKNDHFLIVTNLPKDVEPQKIKKLLSQKIIGINGRVKSVSATEAQIFFSNEGVLERARLCLKGLTIGENKIHISHIVEKRKDCMKTKPDAIKSDNKSEHINTEVKEKKKKSQVELQHNISEERADLSKSATLCVHVHDKLGNAEHWGKEFSKSWGNSEFHLEWNGSNNEGHFFVHFKSLSKAQKAKKIIQKNQKIDLLAPKFIKLIKEDIGIDIGSNISDSLGVEQMILKQVEDCLKMINSKKERCLKTHQEILSEMKNSKKSEISGADEAVNEKIQELNSQKVTFLNFTEKVTKAVQCVNKASENFESSLDNIMRDYSRECLCFTTALPIYAKKTVILKKIKGHQVAIIRAETGSGKSTQLTQYLFREEGVCETGLIVCTQPRKIAAISLAKHVSTQIGCSVGDIVGYQVGLSAKMSSKTRILYMTDFTMLKKIVSDSCIKEVSCVIVDEAHERSIYTDLLLGMLKSCLKMRPDLKVIITSATIDTNIFRDYFNLNDDSVLHVSGRTFPIIDNWLDSDVVLGWNYFAKTVETAYSLLEEEAGDILAFLTTPIETEKAVEAFRNILESNGDQRKILVFQLHGKLDIQEQQKIFDRTPKGFRKVVFSTNCAETSVTIPGISYVVDCGMVKESQFDVKRNMNVLSVGFVSRSSAEQRRGRAGRTQVGKCYRLYSQKNYQDDMTECTDPEILRVNLGQALLKLMEMGVQDPIQFDFVKSPPRESLDQAMRQLMHLEAVNMIDSSLTELGRKMAYLPIEPRLSYLVFQGIDYNVGYEAIILASLVTVSRSIFFRNSENKIKADEKKMRFCQSESDFITYFEVYKEWLEVPKNSRTNWCVINCINARSMRVAHDLIHELISTLYKEINLNLSQKYNADGLATDTLLKIVFHSFSQNICIFSGHHRLGYRSVEVPGELLVHPSSSLYTFGQWRPQYLVYDTLLKTDQTYLINVSHIDENTVVEAYQCGRLEVDLTALHNLALVPLCIGPIGESVIIRDIIGKKGEKLKCLQKRLKTVTQNDSVIIDTNVKKGEVKIFTSEEHHEAVTKVISVSISEGMQKFLDEQREIYNIADCLGLTAVLAAGAEIKDIVLPGEFRDVKIVLKSETIDISDVLQNLMKYGELLLPPRVYKNHYRVTFSSCVCAKEAVNALKDETLFLVQGMSSNILSSQAPFYKVLVSTLRRPCSGEAFFSLDPSSSIPEVSAMFSRQSTCYQKTPLNIVVSKKSDDLRIRGLPPNTDRNSLETLLKSQIEDFPEVKISKLIIVRSKPFDSTKQDVELFKSKLINLFSEFTPKEKIMIDLKKPSSKDFTWNAIVYFKNSHDGETAVNALKGVKYLTETSLQSLVMKPVLQTCLFSKQDIFAVVKDQIEAALNYFNKSSSNTDILNIDAIPKGSQNVQVTITSNNVSDIIDARKSISNFLQGEQINCSGNVVLEKLFSSAGTSFLDELQTTSPSALIHYNIHSKVISLFGDDSTCTKLKTKINSFLDQLEDENYKEIPLRPETCPRGILKELLRSYGFNLEQLKNLCDLTSAEVNSHKQILIIRGSPSSVFQCETILKKIEEELTDKAVTETEGEECPICLDTVGDQYRRLEYCGHAYCKECILNLLQNADTFPINCLICNSRIVVADIIWATKEVKSLELDLFRKALAAFSVSNGEIKYCPSPDCKMLYRVTHEDKDNMFDCPSCNNSVCTKCCVLYHFGMSCELNQCYQKDDDYSLKIWLKENPDNRKMCPNPSCSAPIEKNGGCNHMTCWKCKCHMCWLCLQTFPPGDSVYNHQSVCPRR